MLEDAYTNSYTNITVIGSQLSEILPKLDERIQRLIALEIIESTRTKIVLKDFLEFGAISLPEKLRKIDIIIRSILSDLLSKKTELYGSILSRDNEVDRLYLIIYKAAKKCIAEQSTLKIIKMTLPQLINHMQNAFDLEHYADELHRFTDMLKSSRLSKDSKGKLFPILAKAEKFYLETMRALYKHDGSLAMKLISQKSGIIENIKTLQKKNTQDYPLPLLLGKTIRMIRINASSLRRMEKL